MFYPSHFAIPLALTGALIVSALASSQTDAHRPSNRSHPQAVASVYRTTHITGLPSTRSEWQQYDTAAYVVSTLNLLSRETARAFSARLRTRYHVAEYVVRGDTSTYGLYFIQLVRSRHHVAGAFAYRMGWTKPQAVTRLGLRLGGEPAPHRIHRDYRSDLTRPLGTFTSTLPSYR